MHFKNRSYLGGIFQCYVGNWGGNKLIRRVRELECLNFIILKNIWIVSSTSIKNDVQNSTTNSIASSNISNFAHYWRPEQNPNNGQFPPLVKIDDPLFSRVHCLLEFTQACLWSAGDCSMFTGSGTFPEHTSRKNTLKSLQKPNFAHNNRSPHRCMWSEVNLNLPSLLENQHPNLFILFPAG